MKVIHCSVTNFASYKNLEFKFDGQGLTLISGPTGSGKSTLCDVIPWILFGKTAKGGTVDEIRTWNNGDSTYGRMLIHINANKAMEITRIRSKQNDLYFNLFDPTVYKDTSGIIPNPRGKDLNDTQKQINNLLGFDYELYMSAAYFHEFSQTAQFFTTNAKIRRQITEQMVDLTLAKKLTDNLASYKKDLKKEQEQLSQHVLIKKDRLQSYNVQIASVRQNYGNWFVERKAKIAKLQEQYELFDKVKEHTLRKLQDKLTRYDSDAKRDTRNSITELNALTSSLPKASYSFKRLELEEAIKSCDKELCEHCGAPKKNTQKMVLIDQLHEYKMEEQRIIRTQAEIAGINNSLERNAKLINPYIEQITQEKARQNTYLSQLDEAKVELNPYEDQLNELKISRDETSEDLEGDQYELSVLQTEVSDIELLSKVNEDFRSLLIKNIIVELQNSVNDMLTKHFDAEIKVSFDTADNDKLDVIISKDGNECSFSQLSKGQRQLLKLCFGVSVMTCVQNHHGVSFNAIFMDEFADGLDENMKIRAYGVLEQLSGKHESVFAIDHSEALKSMFSKRYEVELVNGESRIEAL